MEMNRVCLEGEKYCQKVKEMVRMMDKLETIEQSRVFFENDRYATMSGAKILEVGDKTAKCSIRLQDMHRNAVGGIMGGVYFTLADFTFAVATNRQGIPTVSLNANIAFMASAKGEELIATARCVKDGRTTCFYEVDITDEHGNRLVVVTITGFKLDK